MLILSYGDGPEAWRFSMCEDVSYRDKSCSVLEMSVYKSGYMALSLPEQAEQVPQAFSFDTGVVAFHCVNSFHRAPLACAIMLKHLYGVEPEASTERGG